MIRRSLGSIKTLSARATRRPARPRLDHGLGIGGMWERIGRLQFEFLVSEGLRPEHRLLDIGCGALRGGLHFVRYLHPGNYYGVEVEPRNLAAARTNLAAAGLVDRRPHLRKTSLFDVDFGVSFDFVLAQSVFTHLPLNPIRTCLCAVAAVLGEHGRFYATFFRGPRDTTDRRSMIHHAEDGPLVTHPDRNPFHYHPDELRWAARGTGLHAVDLGDWGHPRRQQMMLFTKDAELASSRLSRAAPLPDR
ncbi:MAG: type 12 methyltransferase [Acidimicrobiales bacterium]|nr:MAG: type 12 methyltransferase [Acidimicrobiales bacterium]